ncbi:DUF2784 domain-containing protein [Dactylosporangium sp. NPDC005572]|uniref:DUF2784 domain-containing protein n=1 Tax=Dactylosporangium sp. NPDC005572 TaxID=3156889 RepID=UPI0033B1FCEF
MYRALATTVLVVHFAFLAYVILGGFVAWRWPKAFWPHLAAAAWGLAVVSVPLTCPLTYVEHWARRRAGETGVSRGFIDQYIEGVLYPERYTHLLQVMVGVLVVGSYVGVYVRYRNRRDTKRGTKEMSEPPATV